MPMMQYAVHELNRRLERGEIENQAVEDFDEGLPLSEVAVNRLGIGPDLDEISAGLSTDFASFLDTVPSGIAKALLAIARDAINREQPITLMWKPGYDWELSVTDVAEVGTPGGISILIRSRYPLDTHPAPHPAP